MNVFVLDPCPYQSAKLLYKLDKVRANKQIVELCQMMATLVSYDVPKKDGTPYKRPVSISKHQATLWVTNNFSWCRDYLYELIIACTCGNPLSHGCYGAWLALGNSPKNTGYYNTKFYFLSKIVPVQDILGRQPDSNCDILIANAAYIFAKRCGIFQDKDNIRLGDYLELRSSFLSMAKNFLANS